MGNAQTHLQSALPWIQAGIGSVLTVLPNLIPVVGPEITGLLGVTNLFLSGGLQTLVDNTIRMQVKTIFGGMVITNWYRILRQQEEITIQNLGSFYRNTAADFRLRLETWAKILFGGTQDD